VRLSHLLLLSSVGISFGQPRPAIQNAAFTLNMDETQDSAQVEFPFRIPNDRLTLSIRTLTGAFVSSTPRAFRLEVTCASQNFGSNSIMPLTHMLPVLRHQSGIAVNKDWFSASFEGWIPCVASHPILFRITRNATGDKIVAYFTVSMLIEQVQFITLPAR